VNSAKPAVVNGEPRSLTKTNGDSYDLKFETVSLEQLVDSPLLTGRYFREWPLAPEVSPKHYLDVAADGPEDLEIKPELLAGFNNLVREAGALYKSRHYGSYHFLLTASDQDRANRIRIAPASTTGTEHANASPMISQ